MQPGQTIMIFVDPEARTMEEGRAELLGRASDRTYGIIGGHPMEKWTVKFEDGWQGERFILNTDRNMLQVEKTKICPECGGRHKRREFGSFCTDSCMIDAGIAAQKQYRQFDKDHPSYVKK